MKYFLGLEKVRGNNKTLRAVMCDDNTITRDHKNILTEQAKYYAKLYTHNPKVLFALHDIKVTK